MKRVGVIGVGNMGTPMAINLLKQGYEVIVNDVNDKAVQKLVKQGAKQGSSPQNVADQAEVMVLSLPNIPVLQHVVLGEKGILEADISGKTIIDTTTSTLQASIEVANKVAERGGWMLDSPVTGGVGGAKKGSLSMMIGGEKKAFERQKDIFDTLGSNIVYVGDSGHGQVSKMVNQMLMGAIYCSVAEGFGFASQLGVDIDKIYQAIEGGGAKSNVLSGMKKFILSGEYGQKGNLGQHGKDIDYVMEEGNRNHSYLPITASVHEVWNLARIKGFSDLNAPSIFAVWEEVLDKKLNETIREEE